LLGSELVLPSWTSCRYYWPLVTISQAMPNMLKSTRVGGFLGVFAAAAAALAPFHGGSGTSVVGLGLGLGFGILGGRPVDAWFWDSSSDDNNNDKGDSKDKDKDSDSWDFGGWWDNDSDDNGKNKDDSKDIDINFGSSDGEGCTIYFPARGSDPPFQVEAALLIT